MQNTFQDVGDPTAGAALLVGLAALAAGVGALRRPGIWLKMIQEVEGSPALQFLCGMLEIGVGSAIYLSNPWVPGDLLACVMKTMGGLMIFEALAILALVDVYTQLWLRSLANFHRGWAGITTAIGLTLSVLGMVRFH